MQSRAVVAERASDKSTKFKALTLDFYGTLVDWLSIWEAVSAGIVKKNKLKCSPQEFALTWRRSQRWFFESVPTLGFKEYIKRSLDEVCKTFGIASNGEEQQLFAAWDQVKPFPEVGGVLAELRKRHKLVIVSNSAPDLFDICVKKIPMIFDNVFISDEVGIPKPHKEIYELAVKWLGLPHSEILYVASSQMDLAGATNAGLTVCWINRRKEQRSPGVPPPKYEIYDLNDLLKIVE
jgi:2-haloalkanoic acid dehalogenase type II